MAHYMLTTRLVGEVCKRNGYSFSSFTTKCRRLDKLRKSGLIHRDRMLTTGEWYYWLSREGAGIIEAEHVIEIPLLHFVEHTTAGVVAPGAHLRWIHTPGGSRPGVVANRDHVFEIPLAPGPERVLRLGQGLAAAENGKTTSVEVSFRVILDPGGTTERSKPGTFDTRRRS